MKIGKDIILQTNNVTLAKYKYTEIQENVLICIMGQLQGNMTNKQQTIPFEDNMIIQLDVTEIDNRSRNKRNVVKNIDDLSNIKLEFTLPIDGGKLQDHRHSIITGFSNIRNTNIINVHLNKDILPWITFWGKNVGGTKFELATALTLKGNYAKRIYKLFCMNKGKAFFYTSIKCFIDMVGLGGLSKSNDNNYIKDRVLDPAIEKINAIDDNFDISYEFYVRTKDPLKKKQKADYIKFINKAPSAEFEYENDNEFVTEYLRRIFPNEGKTKGKAASMFNHLSKKKCVEVFAEKLKQIIFEFSEKKKDVVEYRKLITYVLNEDYGFNKKYKPPIKS